MMRWAAVLALGCAGCLYVGERNHPADVQVLLGEGPSGKCGKVLLYAYGNDPDGDRVSYSWRVTVSSLETTRPGEFALPSAVGDVGCTGADLLPLGSGQAPPIGSGPELSLQHLPVRGQYHVDLEAQDVLGAGRHATFDFEVANAPPVIHEVLIARDPLVKTDQVPDVSGYPEHAHYMAWIPSGTGVEDADHDLVCDGSRELVSWELPGLADDDFEDPPEEVACQASRYPLGALRFRLKKGRVVAPEELLVRATVDDGYGGRATGEASLALVANRPPCITAAEPADPGPVVVVHDRGLLLDASQVSDDVLEGVTYVWSMSEGESQPFVPLAGEVGPSLSIPPWFLAPGETVRIRAAVQELGGEAPSCAESVSRCTPNSTTKKVVPEGCYQWVTWTVQFR